jgi:hypothetical protein
MIRLRNPHPDPLQEKVREREGWPRATNLDSNAVVVSLLTNLGNAALGVRGVSLKEAVLPPSADQGDDNVEAAGGEGPDLVLLTIQGVPTTSGTSATQAQAPPSIVVVNIIGNATKGEQERKQRLDIATMIN